MAGLRPTLAALLMVMAALALALAGCGGGKKAACPGASVRVGALGLTVPQGFNRYDIRGGFYRSGTRPPVIGVVVTDYRLKAHSPLRTKGVFPVSSYANRVALEVGLWLGLGPVPARLRLPLSLNEDWVRKHLAHGTRRYGFLSFQGQIYEIFFWAGRAAPQHDRACLLHAIMSIHSAR